MTPYSSKEVDEVSTKLCVVYVEIQSSWIPKPPEKYYTNIKVDEDDVLDMLDDVRVGFFSAENERYDKVILNYQTVNEKVNCTTYSTVKAAFFLIFGICEKLDYENMISIINDIRYLVTSTTKPDVETLYFINRLNVEIERKLKEG